MSQMRDWVESNCLSPDKDIPRHFERTRVKGEWRYQATTRPEHPFEPGRSLKIAYQEDRTIDQGGKVVSREYPAWYTRTTGILHASKDENFFLIGVRLVRPVK